MFINIQKYHILLQIDLKLIESTLSVNVSSLAIFVKPICSDFILGPTTIRVFKYLFVKLVFEYKITIQNIGAWWVEPSSVEH